MPGEIFSRSAVLLGFDCRISLLVGRDDVVTGLELLDAARDRAAGDNYSLERRSCFVAARRRCGLLRLNQRWSQGQSDGGQSDHPTSTSTRSREWCSRHQIAAKCRSQGGNAGTVEHESKFLKGWRMRRVDRTRSANYDRAAAIVDRASV